MQQIIIDLKALHKLYKSSLSPNKLDEELAALIEKLEALDYTVTVASDLHYASNEQPSKFGGPELQNLIIRNLVKGK